MQHEYRDGSSDKSKKKKHKKDKDSDAEDDPNVTTLEPEKIENIKENETGTIVASSVDALISSHDDGADDDQSERQNDHNSKKYVQLTNLRGFSFLDSPFYFCFSLYSSLKSTHFSEKKLL